MKDVASKALGIIAVAISAISIGLIILSFFVDAPVEQGVSRGFACWIFSNLSSYEAKKEQDKSYLFGALWYCLP